MCVALMRQLFLFPGHAEFTRESCGVLAKRAVLAFALTRNPASRSTAPHGCQKAGNDRVDLDRVCAGEKKGVGSMERRRRVPRHTVGWKGKYFIEGDGLEAWHECRVVDISLIGMGIEMFGPVLHPARLVGRHIVVEAPAGASLGIHQRCEVRNVGPGASGGTRVGLEFVDLTDSQRSILDAFVAMGELW